MVVGMDQIMMKADHLYLTDEDDEFGYHSDAYSDNSQEEDSDESDSCDNS